LPVSAEFYTLSLHDALPICLPVGPFSCSVQIDLISKSGERLPGVVLPIAGKMQPEVRAIPAQLVFGPRRVGQTAESSVTLQEIRSEEHTSELQSQSNLFCRL